MTAITTPARADRATSRRPVPWTRLAWVTYRQHRPALTGAAVFLGLISVYLLIMGLKANHAYAAVAACRPVGSGVCHQLRDAFDHGYWGGDGGSAMKAGGAQTISSLMLVVPVVLGTFLGAPLLARELETGTFRFAWTQGCGRVRWAVSKLLLLAVVVTGVIWAFTELGVVGIPQVLPVEQLPNHVVGVHRQRPHLDRTGGGENGLKGDRVESDDAVDRPALDRGPHLRRQRR